MQVELSKVAVKPDGYPTDNLPEIALAGRSNVGKSSLINTMLGRKSLARISGNPGKTRTINFYLVENSLYFVDLPGYGYAKAAKTEVSKWGKMIETYLTQREQLKTIVLLLDIRHPPTKDDITMHQWINYYGYNATIVATKLDKIKRSQIDKHKKMIREGLGVGADTEILTFSSLDKVGSERLWEVLREKSGIKRST